MKNSGIKFSKSGSNVSADDNVTYVVDNDTLQVAPKLNKSPLVGLIDPLPAMSAWSVTFAAFGDTQTRTETLLEVEHNLPFTPDFSCYMYVIDSITYPADIGRYNLDFMLLGSFGERLYAMADEKYFRIIHCMKSEGPTSPGVTYPYTTTVNAGSLLRLRVKYLIYTIPSCGTLEF